MKVCPKCDKQYEDASKICRMCGAILEDATPLNPPDEADSHSVDVEDQRLVVASEPPQTTTVIETDESERAEVMASAYWVCSKCRETIEGNFEICWKCGTGRDGTEDPNFAVEGSADDRADLKSPAHPDHGADVESAAVEHIHRDGAPCAKCSSMRVIRDVVIEGEFPLHIPQPRVILVGKPDALMFRSEQIIELRADICGDCGHVEWRVSDPKRIYREFVSRQAVEMTIDPNE